jgi:hypothetical protein
MSGCYFNCRLSKLNEFQDWAFRFFLCPLDSLLLIFTEERKSILLACDLVGFPKFEDDLLRKCAFCFSTLAKLLWEAFLT